MSPVSQFGSAYPIGVEQIQGNGDTHILLAFSILIYCLVSALVESWPSWPEDQLAASARQVWHVLQTGEYNTNKYLNWALSLNLISERGFIVENLLPQLCSQ